MIRSKGLLIAVGVISLIVGLILNLPARVAIHWMAPSEIAIGGIEGTVWNGSARELLVRGIYLREVNWSLSTMQVLVGKFTYDVEANPISGFFESELQIKSNGEIVMSELRATLPVSLLSSAIGINELQGQSNLIFDRLELVNGFPIVADGTVNIIDLVIPLVGRDLLGDYEIEFFTQSNSVSASVIDNNGLIDFAGSLQIRNDRSFEFIGLIIPGPETPAAIRRQLQFLPPANDQGQQELRLEGIL